VRLAPGSGGQEAGATPDTGGGARAPHQGSAGILPALCSTAQPQDSLEEVWLALDWVAAGGTPALPWGLDGVFAVFELAGDGDGVATLGVGGQGRGAVEGEFVHVRGELDG
jgi:hypothetical protein